MSYAKYRHWSPLATRASRPRDVSDRSWVHGLMVHTTGGSIVAKAKRLGRDPLEYATEEYATPGRTFAQYLIGHKGEIVQIAADTEAAWQSAWKPWEQREYQGGGWRRKWARDYDSDVIEVPESHYRWWDSRWPRYSSPIQLSKVAAGASTLAIPNKTYLGAELLDHRPFTQEQYSSLARWIVDRSLVWTIPFTSDPFKDRVVLPTPYLLGHEDINPCRRSAPSGPWDPGDRLDWGLLLSKLITLLDMDLSEWYPPAQGA